MRHRSAARSLRVASGAMFAFTLAACAATSHPSGARTPTTAASATTTTAATATSGPVSVTPDKPHYAQDDTIVVTIRNGLALTILARDERSDCSVVDLERWNNGTWEIQAPCVNMQPRPHVVEIAPGAVLTEQLAPQQSDLADNQWQAGTYRIAFAYVTSPSQPFGQSTIVYSASFTIG
jgi:hypothetical protein